ncbi:malonate decarboxylase holo-ACP synthase [Paludibacterium yongneupense]|uniref:malonate decarboxylase holo-ACP synthase n=1 Tax=Paludibacterium yongneupense TaxID=400061 RepID=UPI00040A311A|nr:malonate decarboxylase holo-ACP synthase [Paludibacterium yongneupense]
MRQSRALRMPSATLQRARPHDLLFLGAAQALLSDDPLPPWADRHWLDRAPAVVRRAPTVLPGVVPVGLRGRTRSERFAAWIHEREVATLVTPESLSRARTWQQYRDWSDAAPIRALEMLAPRLDRLGCDWGVTGSVGFSIASSIRLLSADSDLDLLIRQEHSMTRSEARAIVQLSSDLPCRCDIQIETPQGAFSLLEWARNSPRVLLKTENGPRLCTSPWASADEEGASS